MVRPSVGIDNALNPNVVGGIVVAAGEAFDARSRRTLDLANRQRPSTYRAALDRAFADTADVQPLFVRLTNQVCVQWNPDAPADDDAGENIDY
jgi:hypothetical protein